jgi:hypothetical protein
MTTKDVTDLLKKYATKSAVIVALVVLLGVGVNYTLNTKAKLDLTRSELSASQALNSLIGNEVLRLDSLEKALNKQVKERDVQLAIKDKKIAQQYVQIGSLKDSLKHTLTDVAQLTADSSYRYINARIKPVTELKYPFDSTQVKTIHYTFLERDGLFTLNGKQEGLITDLRLVSSIKDNQIVELKSLNSVYIGQRDICKIQNDAYTIQIKGLNKNITKQKTLKFIGGGTTVGLAAYIIIRSIFK